MIMIDKNTLHIEVFLIVIRTVWGVLVVKILDFYTIKKCKHV